MKRMVVLLALLLVTASCGSDDDAAGTDPDAPLGAGPYAIADLTVTYEHPDTGEIVYRFACLGDTATLVGDISDVDAIAACTALTNASVVERLVDGVPADQVCTEIYGGDERATIVGTLEGQPVDTTADRANGCGIDDWDGVLSALLPPPRPFT